MKNKFPLLAIACLLMLHSPAQSGLYLSPGTNLFIGTGTIFSTDSLVIIPSSNFIIAGQNSITRNASVTHLTTNPYIQRVFHLSSTLSSYSGAVSIYYRDEELNGLNETALTLNVHDGSSWNAYNLNITRDAVNNYVSTTGLTNINLNELTLAGFSSPLPLTYTFFNTFCTGNSVKLNWKTAQEFNTKNFEIEKLEGQRWVSIASITAAGFSSAQQSYSWTDNQSSGNVLYRIVEYDIDGRKTISNIIRSSCSQPDLFAVYPNPLHNTATINININETASLALKVYDAKGSLVKQSQTDLLQGTNLVQLDMTSLAAGTYHLIAQWNQTVKSIKIVKE